MRERRLRDPPASGGRPLHATSTQAYPQSWTDDAARPPVEQPKGAVISFVCRRKGHIRKSPAKEAKAGRASAVHPWDAAK